MKLIDSIKIIIIILEIYIVYQTYIQTLYETYTLLFLQSGVCYFYLIAN